jgi:hypothetical protein
MKLYALIIAAFLSTPSFAAKVSIEMLNKDANGNKMVYSQEVAKVDFGSDPSGNYNNTLITFPIICYR